MRLTFRVTSSGDRWAVDAPTFDYGECWPAQDTFDEAAFRRQVRANERYVQMGSHDNDSVMRFSSLVFHAVSTWLKENVVSRKDMDRDLLRADNTMKARQRRGKFGFVRMEIRPATIHVVGDDILRCEMLEAWCALNDQETISELYDAVAVLMRMIAVVEGKQKLGGEK